MNGIENKAPISEPVCQNILDTLADPVYVIDRSFQIISSNQQCHRWLERIGIQTDPLGKRLPEIFPFLSQEALEEYAGIFKTGRSVIREDRILIGGNVFFIEVKKIPITEAEEVAKVITIQRDLTKEKEAQAGLILEKNKFQALIDSLEYGVTLQDSAYNIIFQNEHIQKLPRNASRKCYQAYEFRDGLCEDCPVEKAFQDGRSHTVEKTVITPSGETVIVENTATPVRDMDGNLSFCIEIVRDVTHRKRMEAAMRRRVAFEQLMARISSEFAGFGDADNIESAINRLLEAIGSFTDADRAYIFQFKEDGLRIDNTHEWCAEGVAPQIEHLKGIEFGRELPWIAGKLRKHRTVDVPSVAALPRKAHRERDHFEAQGIQSLLVVPMIIASELKGFLGFDDVRKNRVWADDDRNLLQFFGDMISHVISRNRVEKEHARLRKELANAIEMAHLGPWEYDLAEDKFTFTDHFYKIFRSTAAQAGGYTMTPEEYTSRFVHPDDLPVVSEEIRKAVETTDPNYNRVIEHRMLYSDGTVGHIIVKIFIVKDAHGKTVKIFGVNQNITDRKQAEQKLRENEEKLVRSKKMESLGLLAGGVAHDLNNILSGIVTYPELLLLDMPQESPLRKPVETIQTCGRKAVAIVQDLLTIARGVAIEKYPLNLNDVINNYLESPEHHKIIQFHPKVTVNVALEDHLLNIKGSVPHIGKAVMNLVANACEAIDGIGTVVLKTENRYVDRPLKGYDDVNTGEYAVLAIKDSGPGIPPDEIDRIFEPFYSKKVMGRSGTGLGLAVVWNVMQDHYGYINVSGEDEGGTTFELYFPITREELWQKAASLSIADYRGKGEMILVVDDEESQREIFRGILDVLGYRVETVGSGEAALDYLKAHSVDLVILDMIMDPGINGRETYERIQKIHPDQKAIIVSGFAETDEVKKAQRLGAGRYIKKPVQIEKIGLAIQQALGA